ncbi:hypothetical protein H4S14_003590 [Agrobacterium vitis]|nr:hypothetical protein [Agrobacterium vitis]MBE1439825.1 hypothetical protein [Agrobacterium vitis]
MAFIFTLDAHWVTTLTLLKLETVEGEYIFQVPVGFDDETNAVISAFVCFATVAGYGSERYELVFHVVVADADGPDWRSDGLETVTILRDKKDRQRVLSVILYGARRLIEEVKPLTVFMTTHELNLPEKALVKYDKIAGVFAPMGYRAGRGDPMHGQQIWMMEK